MKIALVHDYIKEFGGAERVLMTLHEMFPDAPIYTAFVTPNSTAAQAFKDALPAGRQPKIIPSWANFLIRSKNLHSPFRFLMPLIWESFDFSDYDVVIFSSSGYICKQIRTPKNVKVINYCHTPPRFLYGYDTAFKWQNYWYSKLYGIVFSHFLRLYDFLAAQRVDLFIANSKNTAGRIKKFYRKDSVVIYPPIEIPNSKLKIPKKEDFYLVVSRIAGAKGIDMAMEAANKLKINIKFVGEYAGIKNGKEKIDSLKTKYTQFLGRVDDETRDQLYAQAKGFLALGNDEDFGITPVESMAAGTPVIAYKSGGYLETVIDGKTGVFFEEYNVESLIKAIVKFNSLKFNKNDCTEQAKKFSREKFIKSIQSVILEAEGR